MTYEDLKAFLTRDDCVGTTPRDSSVKFNPNHKHVFAYSELPMKYKSHGFWRRWLEEKQMIGPGSRNTELYKFGTFVAPAYTDWPDKVREMNRDRCVPPLSDREVERIIESIDKNYTGVHE